MLQNAYEMMKLIRKSKNRVLRQARILRHRYIDDFVFIHINKTGGSSIEKALNIPLEHVTALEKIEQIGRDKWSKMFTFTVVRNPWDKVVSHYHYRVQTNQTNLGDKTIGFKDWVKLSYGNQDPLYYDRPKMFMPQCDWITDHDGTVLVDYYCRFEDLSGDFKKVCKQLQKNVDLPHIKASKRGIYTEYYDEESIKIIEQWFRRDIELFDYSF